MYVCQKVVSAGTGSSLWSVQKVKYTGHTWNPFLPHWPPVSWHKQCHLSVSTIPYPHSEVSPKYLRSQCQAVNQFFTSGTLRETGGVNLTNGSFVIHHSSWSKWLGQWYSTVEIILGPSFSNSFWISLEWSSKNLNWFSQHPRPSKGHLLLILIWSTVIKGRKWRI